MTAIYGCSKPATERAGHQSENLEMTILTAHKSNKKGIDPCHFRNRYAPKIERQSKQIAHIKQQNLAGGYAETLLPNALKANCDILTIQE